MSCTTNNDRNNNYKQLDINFPFIITLMKYLFPLTIGNKKA